MKIKHFVVGLVLIVESNFDLLAQENYLQYSKPATLFEEAIPIGNGRIGAMVYGGIDKERLSLNDITLWTGEPVLANHNPEAYKTLPAVRQALFSEDYAAADTLVRKLQGNFSESYAPLGNLTIDFDHNHKIENYKRTLDLKNSKASVSYVSNGTLFTRSYIASYPDQLIVIKLNAKGSGRLNININFNSLLLHQVTANSNLLTMQGRAPVHAEPNYRSRPNPIIYLEKRGTRFAAQLAVHATDGKAIQSDTSISIRDATDIELHLSLATSFNGFDKDPYRQGLNEITLASGYLKKAKKYNYSTIIKKHETDYKNFYDRVQFNLRPNANLLVDTDGRLKESDINKDQGLIALYFNFGRYLLISSSRTASVPINLQGLWNESIRPPWSSNYTVNINTEMNYWPIETANLSELHTPLLSFINNLAKTGEVTAKTYYDCKGWTCHHNSDIWSMTNPVGAFGQGDPNWANWPMGGAWLATHLWEHYQYTLDKAFLSNQAYALLKGAARFCLDYLVKDPKGFLVTAPSTSPENIYVTTSNFKGATLYGSTADLAMIRELFLNVIQASKVLQLDISFRDSLSKVLNQIYPYQISQQGHLQEWYHDWNDQEVTHRHLSHLYGVYPGMTITPNQPLFFEAAKKSLLRRTNNGTGWSIAWKISMWARLLDGDKAYDALQKLLNYYPADKNEIKVVGGGTYPNLFDAHPPFQIDGNFGGVAGIIELLMQSHEEFIHILPALPSAWSEGSIRGIKARGNIEVRITWSKGEPTKVALYSKQPTNKKIKYQNQIMEVKVPAHTWTHVKL